MDVFPTISRKICEIVNKKDGSWETKLAELNELKPFLDHTNFNKMLLQETSANINVVLNSIKEGLVKENTRDLSKQFSR
jgi:hypothetical protein